MTRSTSENYRQDRKIPISDLISLSERDARTHLTKDKLFDIQMGVGKLIRDLQKASLRCHGRARAILCTAPGEYAVFSLRHDKVSFYLLNTDTNCISKTVSVDAILCIYEQTNRILSRTEAAIKGSYQQRLVSPQTEVILHRFDDYLDSQLPNPPNGLSDVTIDEDFMRG